jgi:hypothetical protein
MQNPLEGNFATTGKNGLDSMYFIFFGHCPTDPPIQPSVVLLYGCLQQDL